MIHTQTWENQLHATKWNKTKLKHYVMWREVLTTMGHHKIILGIGGLVLHLDCVVVVVQFYAFIKPHAKKIHVYVMQIKN